MTIDLAPHHDEYLISPQNHNWYHDYQCLSTGRENCSFTALFIGTREVYAGDSSGNIYLWAEREGSYLLKRSFVEHTDKINDLIVHGHTLYSASDDGAIKVWNTSELNCIKTLNGHSGPVLSIVLSPTGILFSGGEDATIREWSAERWIITGSECGVSQLAISSQISKTLYSVDGCHLRSWDLETGKSIQTFAGHGGQITTLVIVDITVMTAGMDGQIRVWNGIDGTLISCFGNELESSIHGLIWYRNAILSVDQQGEFACWDSSSQVPSYQFKSQHSKKITKFKCNSNCGIFGTCSEDGQIHIWRDSNVIGVGF
jgi:WD40 repeat protein